MATGRVHPDHAASGGITGPSCRPPRGRPGSRAGGEAGRGPSPTDPTVSAPSSPRGRSPGPTTGTSCKRIHSDPVLDLAGQGAAHRPTPSPSTRRIATAAPGDDRPPATAAREPAPGRRAREEAEASSVA